MSNSLTGHVVNVAPHRLEAVVLTAVVAHSRRLHARGWSPRVPAKQALISARRLQAQLSALLHAHAADHAGRSGRKPRLLRKGRHLGSVDLPPKQERHTQCDMHMHASCVPCLRLPVLPMHARAQVVMLARACSRRKDTL